MLHRLCMLDLFSFSAIENNFSPDNSSSIVTEKNVEISFSESMLGYPLPHSHFDIVLSLIPNNSDNCLHPRNVENGEYMRILRFVDYKISTDFLFNLYHNITIGYYEKLEYIQASHNILSAYLHL